MGTSVIFVTDLFNIFKRFSSFCFLQINSQFFLGKKPYDLPVWKLGVDVQ